MKHKLSSLLAAFILLPSSFILLSGCATIQPGNDPVLVNAERTTATAYDTFDSFFALERQNDSYVKAHAPAIHKFTNDLRRNAPKYLHTARALTETYRVTRTAENKANLVTAIAVLTEAINQIQAYQPMLKSSP